MRTVWKYPLELVDEQTIELPRGANPLSVGCDPQGMLCLWARVETVSARVPWEIRIVGTGNDMGSTDETPVEDFVGTAVGYVFVWHVFARPQQAQR